MSKICTNLEQSKRLQSLGIDVNTADMYYPNRIGIDNYPLPIEWKNGNPLLSQEIPAWSLTALLEMLPEGFLLMDNQGETEPILYSIWVPGYDKPHIWKNNLVDAAFGMICWLKENGKL